MEGRKVLQAREKNLKKRKDRRIWKLLQDWELEWKNIVINTASHSETRAALTFGEYTLGIHFKRLSRKLQNYLSGLESFNCFSKQNLTLFKEI